MKVSENLVPICKQALRMTEDKGNKAIEVDLQDDKELVKKKKLASSAIWNWFGVKISDLDQKKSTVSCVDALC